MNRNGTPAVRTIDADPHTAVSCGHQTPTNDLVAPTDTVACAVHRPSRNEAADRGQGRPRVTPRRGQSRHALWRPIVLFLLALSAALLTACGAPPAPPIPELACEREGYPCTYGEVPLAVIERSLSVASEAGAMLENGATTDEVLAFVDGQPDLATVFAFEDAVEFRLEGGMPVVIDPTVDVPLLPGENAQVASVGTGDAGRASDVGRPAVPSDALAPQLVVGASGTRSALVLSPYTFDYQGWDTGAQAASVLAATPGFEGRVTYRETTDPDQPVVTVEDLTNLKAYDVVYLSTHGGSLCYADKTAHLVTSGEVEPSSDCRADILVQRFHGTAADLQTLDHPGVVLYQGSKHLSIAVTGDFFRATYPDGLPNTLFVLVSCSTFTPELYVPIAGDWGVFVSWDGNVHSDTTAAALKMLQILSDKGWTVTEAMDSLGDLLVDETTGAVMRSSDRRAGGDLRLRDLVRVEDVYTFNQFPNAYEIGVTGAPDDGQADEFVLDVTVDGATVTSVSSFVLNVEINGISRVRSPLSSLGTLHDDHTWNAMVEVPLGFDAMEGEEVNVNVWVDLPEGGTSGVEATPMVVGSPSELGTVWQGQVRYEHARNAGDWTMVITADVVFEREPGSDPGARYQWYTLTGGSYLVELQGEDALGCTVSGNLAGTLEADEYASMTFDTATSPILLEAWGNSKTPPMVAAVVCPDGDSSTQTIDTNKVFLNIPESAAATVSNSTAVGVHVEANGTTTTTWNWNLAMTE